MRLTYLVPIGLAAAGVPFLSHVDVHGAGPNQTVSHWDWTNQCVTGSRWTYDTEQLVKQTLPNEWRADWLAQALRAGATIIRQDSWYFYNHPESAVLGSGYFCYGVSPYQYDWRDSRMAFRSGSGAAETDNAVDATFSYGWASNSRSQNDLYLRFGSCLQYDTQTQAANGYSWQDIVGAQYYAPGEYASNNPCGASGGDAWDGSVVVYAPLYQRCLYSCGGGR